ncbi:MAG: ATP phosphoribosyltransferase regulatory subunit, partial [archaeon]|nr:ATP phosphoribosyltransferase regulatory subunit [archaeon]
KKKTISQIIDEYAGKGIDEDIMSKIIKFGNLRGKPDDVLFSLNVLGLQNLNDLMSLTESLDARGMKNILLSMGIVRGLDYYDGIVFEVFDEENTDIGALAGGGRFDSLPAIFGRPDLSATGVAGGVERIALALSKISKVKIEELSLIYVAYANKDFIRQATQLASELRRNGIRTEFDLSGKSLKKQMESASSLNAKYVMILAPREYAQKRIVVKNMIDGTEIQIGIDEALSFLKANI